MPRVAKDVHVHGDTQDLHRGSEPEHRRNPRTRRPSTRNPKISWSDEIFSSERHDRLHGPEDAVSRTPSSPSRTPDPIEPRTPEPQVRRDPSMCEPLSETLIL